MRFSKADAALLAAGLDVDYAETPICLACLTFVSFPLDRGDQRAARRAATSFAPHFWDEGLDEQTRLALQRARRARVERAAEAIREIEQLGPRSEVVRAIVLRLAEAQVDEMRARWPRGA